MENTLRNPQFALEPAELLHFFLSHLNRIYCAKSELIEKLPLLEERAFFLDLRHAVRETIDAVCMQIIRMKEIYIKLDAVYQSESCIGLTGILDEAFQSVGGPNDSAALGDLSILFYMQNIESIEMSSFKVLMRVADGLQQPAVAQLLAECFDEAQEDKALFRAITDNYL